MFNKRAVVAAPLVTGDDAVIVAVQPAEPHLLLRLGLFVLFPVLRLRLVLSVALVFVLGEGWESHGAESER
jgi:hypothetical protein